MKKVFVVFLLTAILAMVSLVAADTNELPGAGWNSGQQIQNVGADSATIDLTAYGQDGTAYDCDATDPNPLPSGSSFTWLADQCDTPAGFEGSAVASSDQPIVAVVAVSNDNTASGQYTGTDGGDVADTLAFPLVKNDHSGRTTTFFIQNASSNVNNIDVTFKDLSGTEYTNSYANVPANAMVVVNPSDAGMPTGSGTGLGSLIVEGEYPMAGASLEHETTTTSASNLQASRAFVPNDYDTSASCPLVRHAFGGGDADTGIMAQNATTDQTFDISVTYEVIAGPNGARTVGPVTVSNVGPGEAANFLQSVDLDEGEIGAATVSGDGNIAVIVNDKLNGYSPARVTTYACFGESTATNTIAIPLAKDNFSLRRTGIQVQNVGNVATAMTLTYVNSEGDTIVVETTSNVAAGASKTFLDMANGATSGVQAAAGSDLADLINGPWGAGGGGISGVTITADQPIVAIALEASYGSKNLDGAAYEGFNQD